MTRGLIVLATAAAMTAAIVPAPAQAGNGGAVAAGIIGGLAAGAIIGSAASAPRYYAPDPVYAEPPPPPSCSWTRGEPMWDGARHAWVRRACRSATNSSLGSLQAPAHPRGRFRL
jgi:hypothetical protein